MSQKIIIDTDPGIDDATAIHMALADPRLEIVGMTIVFGNVNTTQATRDALHLAAMAAYPAAVASGATKPRLRDAAPPADFVHGAEEFGDLPAPALGGRADDRVFTADWHVTIVGLDITEKTQCTPADFASIAAAAARICGFLESATGFYFDFHEAKRGPRICFMHDPSAVIAITDPDLIGFEGAPITVTCEGDEIGRTVLEGNGRREVAITTEVDSKVVRRRFLDTVMTADERGAARKAAVMN